MGKHSAGNKPAITYTLARGQLGCLYLCFVLIGGVVIWLGAIMEYYAAPRIWWSLALAQAILLLAYAALAVLFIQWHGDKRHYEALFAYVDAETDETFTPVGDEMEV